VAELVDARDLIEVLTTYGLCDYDPGAKL